MMMMMRLAVQELLNAVYEGPDFDIATRYPIALNTLFVCMMYSYVAVAPVVVAQRRPDLMHSVAAPPCPSCTSSERLPLGRRTGSTRSRVRVAACCHVVNGPL